MKSNNDLSIEYIKNDVSLVVIDVPRYLNYQLKISTSQFWGQSLPLLILRHIYTSGRKKYIYSTFFEVNSCWLAWFEIMFLYCFLSNLYKLHRHWKHTLEFIIIKKCLWTVTKFLFWSNSFHLNFKGRRIRP